jgi:hypothetical protein
MKGQTTLNIQVIKHFSKGVVYLGINSILNIYSILYQLLYSILVSYISKSIYSLPKTNFKLGFVLK